MRKILERLATRLTPRATGKAIRIEGGCYFGCGNNGVYVPYSGARAQGGKLPCC